MKSLLPYWSLYEERFDYNETKLITYAVIVYFCILLFVILIGLGIYINWKYILKKGQRRKMQLLILFYAMTFVISAIRIYNMLFFAHINYKGKQFEFYLPILMQYNVCVLQCWMMLELSLRMRQTLY